MSKEATSLSGIIEVGDAVNEMIRKDVSAKHHKGRRSSVIEASNYQMDSTKTYRGPSSNSRDTRSLQIWIATTIAFLLSTSEIAPRPDVPNFDRNKIPSVISLTFLDIVRRLSCTLEGRSCLMIEVPDELSRRLRQIGRVVDFEGSRRRRGENECQSGRRTSSLQEEVYAKS